MPQNVQIFVEIYEFILQNAQDNNKSTSLFCIRAD